jgi:hypothetical protein
MTWVGATGDCATAVPIAVTVITYIPNATAVPMINCVMLLRMIASIREPDCRRLWEAGPHRCDGHHKNAGSD